MLLFGPHRHLFYLLEFVVFVIRHRSSSPSHVSLAAGNVHGGNVMEDLFAIGECACELYDGAPIDE